MATQTLITRAQFDKLDPLGERRLELFEGELIELPSPTPKHQRILTRLTIRLASFERRLLIDTDFELTQEIVCRPDLAILSDEDAASINPTKVPVMTFPQIAVEVISPNDTAPYVERKTRAYLEHGVTEVWLIYDDHLAVHTLTGSRYVGPKDSLNSPLLPGWSLPVSELFA